MRCDSRNAHFEREFRRQCSANFSLRFFTSHAALSMLGTKVRSTLWFHENRYRVPRGATEDSNAAGDMIEGRLIIRPTPSENLPLIIRPVRIDRIEGDEVRTIPIK